MLKGSGVKMQADELTMFYIGVAIFFFLLIPAFVVRFLIKREQLSVGGSIAVAAAILLLAVGLVGAGSSSTGEPGPSPAVPAFASFISFFICRYKKERIW